MSKFNPEADAASLHTRAGARTDRVWWLCNAVGVTVIVVSMGACGGGSTVAEASSSVTPVESEEVPQSPAPARRASSVKGVGVSALGRLEPEGGIRLLSVPSMPIANNGAIVADLLVEEGDLVAKDQVIAVTESARVLQAVAAELESELRLAQRHAAARRLDSERECALAGVSSREAGRLSRLKDEGVVAEGLEDRARTESVAGDAACRAARAEVDISEASIETARARLARARVEEQRAYLRAPSEGAILKVLAYPGELVGANGVVEFGNVKRMFAIAEVYETDIARVRLGQSAEVSSPALAKTLTGTVHRIRQKVQKQDLMDTDPAARRDARVVEVEILLDDPEPAASLTNLQVEVVIAP